MTWEQRPTSQNPVTRDQRAATSPAQLASPCVCRAPGAGRCTPDPPSCALSRLRAHSPPLNADVSTRWLSASHGPACVRVKDSDSHFLSRRGVYTRSRQRPRAPPDSASGQVAVCAPERLAVGWGPVVPGGAAVTPAVSPSCSVVRVSLSGSQTSAPSLLVLRASRGL